MIAFTATKIARWHVVPVDNKWFTWLVVVPTIVEHLERLDPHFPDVDKEQRKAMAKARNRLLDATQRKKEDRDDD